MDITTLLTAEQHGDVVATVLGNNPGMDQLTAARIVDEALKYVATYAAFPTAYIAPSRVVDEGWHALILHTALYATCASSSACSSTTTPRGPTRTGRLRGSSTVRWRS